MKSKFFVFLNKIDNMISSIQFFLTIIVVVFVDITCGFTILEKPLVEPNKSPHIGSDLIITCTSSSAHDHCIWKHNNNVCKFDWDKRHRNVLNPNCEAYGERLTFHGIYPAHECKMRLTNITKSDSGKWTCEMDNNKKKISQDIIITVIQRPIRKDNESGNKAGDKDEKISKKILTSQNKTVSSVTPTQSTTQSSVLIPSLNAKKPSLSSNQSNNSGNI